MSGEANASPPRVLITGASGMLGRALYRLLEQFPQDYCILGAAFGRAHGNLRKLNLLDKEAVHAVLQDFKPDVLVHCAAERDPDRAAADPDGTRALNVGTTEMLAQECASLGASMIYMSTDYVFDGGVHTGVACPYPTSAPTHPLNSYGQSKLDGETAVLAIEGCRPLVLRVPVLYATDCADVSESASLAVAKTLLSKGEQKVDNWGVRFPTLVDDVAKCLKAFIDLKHANPAQATGIFHCSSPHRTSKYELAKLMAAIVGQDSSRLLPNNDPPAGAPRPQNTQLDCAATWEVLGQAIEFSGLEDGIAAALEPFKDQLCEPQ